MAIDFHVHIFPDDLAAGVIDKLYGYCDIVPRSDGTMAGLRASMARNGISHSVLQPVATSPRQVQKLNDLAARQNGEEGIFSFGAMHLAYDGWAEELERIRDMGLKGIKLHHDYMGIFFDDPRSIRVIRRAGELGLAVLIHAGDDPVSRDVHYCPPEMIRRVLPEIRGTTLICSHFGGLWNMEEARDNLAGQDVYLDTSMTHHYFGIYWLGKLLKSHDPDKILFGSDSPWEDQGTGLRLLDSMGLGDELVEKIAWKNPARLLGLE